MKALLYAFFILLSANTFAQKTAEDLYNAMADDMCDCVNKYANKISPGMRQAIIQAGVTPENMEAIIQEQVMQDPEQGLKDIDAITALAEGMEKCGNDIDKKHKKNENYNSGESAEVVQQKIMEAMRNQKDCAFTYALMVIGLYGESSEDEYYDEEYYDEEE